MATLKKAGDPFPSFVTICELYIPCFAPWCLLFVLKDYLDSPGREFLFVYKQSRDSLLRKMVILWILYVLHILLVFSAAAILYDFVWFLFIAIIMQSFFLTALAYFLAVLLQNAFVPLITEFTYSLIFMLGEVIRPSLFLQKDYALG